MFRINVMNMNVLKIIIVLELIIFVFNCLAPNKTYAQVTWIVQKHINVSGAYVIELDKKMASAVMETITISPLLHGG